ncbi:hypothetical protein ABU186_08115 [Weissella paramesenteroides]
MNRKGVTLFETMVVLSVCLVLSIPVILPKDDNNQDWQNVKQEFAQKYIKEQQKVVLGKELDFNIYGYKNTIIIGSEKIKLPRGWFAGNYVHINWRSTTVTADTISFVNRNTNKHILLIFQLEGGTYRFTT